MYVCVCVCSAPYRVLSVSLCVCISMCVCVLVYISLPLGDTRSVRTQALLGVVGSLALSVVGIVDEKEDATAHDIAAAVFFIAYDVYMVLYAVNALARVTRPNAHSRFMVGMICFAVSVVSKLRFSFVQHALHDHPAMTHVYEDSYFAVYEWCDLLVCLVFVNATAIYNAAHGTARRFGVALVEVGDCDAIATWQ